MEQRSQEWFTARKGRITGSMVGAALGLDPNTTREEAMRRMVRAYQGLPSEFVGNVATSWGTNHEEEAREDFEYTHNTSVAPATFVVHPTLPWLGASPDGYVSSHALLEIKCPYGLRDKPKPVQFKSINVQPHYYAQMQIQMYCTDRIACYFWQWTPNDHKLEIVDYDPIWIKENLPKLEAFYKEFLAICDEGMPEPEEKLDLGGEFFQSLIAEYDAMTLEIEQSEKRRKEIMEQLVFESAGQDAVICGRKLTQVHRAGSVSYAKAIKELAPNADLEKWRGEPTSYWTLK
ncbi:MAG: YqaJ viral recombinase family protein [Rhodoferax sp.]|nr:YqaJ viral recombinase family protein [Rhodoferax sp.]